MKRARVVFREETEEVTKHNRSLTQESVLQHQLRSRTNVLFGQDSGRK